MYLTSLSLSFLTEKIQRQNHLCLLGRAPGAQEAYGGTFCFASTLTPHSLAHGSLTTKEWLCFCQLPGQGWGMTWSGERTQLVLPLPEQPPVSCKLWGWTGLTLRAQNTSYLLERLPWPHICLAFCLYPSDYPPTCAKVHLSHLFTP